MGWDGAYCAKPVGKAATEKALLAEIEFDGLTVDKIHLVKSPGTDADVAYVLADIGEEKVPLVVLYEYRNGAFMKKVMDETVGPYYFDFPVAWLDELGPPKNDWAKNWRETVVKEAA